MLEVNVFTSPTDPRKIVDPSVEITNFKLGTLVAEVSLIVFKKGCFGNIKQSLEVHKINPNKKACSNLDVSEASCF